MAEGLPSIKPEGEPENVGERILSPQLGTARSCRREPGSARLDVGSGEDDVDAKAMGGRRRNAASPDADVLVPGDDAVKPPRNRWRSRRRGNPRGSPAVRLSAAHRGVGDEVEEALRTRRIGELHENVPRQ